MATGPFTRIYPSTGDGYITMDGGLSSNFPRSVIADNESPDCLNVVFEDGTVATREGTTLLNTTAVGSFTGDGLYTRHDDDGSETMVAFWDGTAFALTGTSTFTTIASAQSVFTAGTRISASEYENHLFTGNGAAIPYKYNGTDWTRHGIYPPTATMTAATNSGGTLTGDYQYKLTFVNSNLVESDVGPVTATFTAASEDIAITSIPVGVQSFGVSTRKLYRTEAGGTTFKLLATLNDNTTSSYTDNISDSALGADAPTDQGVPPTYDSIAYLQDRLFVNDPGNKNLVWYSELANPYVFKSTNFLRIGDKSGKNVEGIVAYNNGIVVSTMDSMELIYMPDTTPGNWVKIVLRVPFGSKSRFALQPFQDRLIFPALQSGKFVGVGSIVGSSIEPDATFLTVLTAGGELISQKIEDQMFTVVDGQVKNFSSIAFKNRVYITLTYTSGGTKNDRVYVLNYNIDNLSKVQKFSWVPWTGMNAVQFTVYDNKLYYVDANATGRVFRMLDGTYNDNSAAIDSYYWTKEFNGFKGDENFMKDHRFLNFLVENSGAWKMDVLARTDSDKGDGDVHEVDLDPGSNLWGTLVFGTDNWGGGADEKDVKLFLGSLRGKRVQFKFTNQNTADQKFKVHWIKHAYNRKGYR
jgi:hypothetical protein